MDLKARWQGMTPRNKLLAIGGGVLLLIILAAGAGQGGYGGRQAAYNGGQPGPEGYGPQGYGPPGYGPPGYGPPGYGPPGYAPQGHPPQGYPPQGGPQGYASAPPGYGGGPGYAPPQGGYAPGGGGADDPDPNGYYARQRSQDQRAEAFDQYIRDTNTVRNEETGEVTSNVSNDVADPAIASGAYTEVPTSELPVSSPAPEAAPAESASPE